MAVNIAVLSSRGKVFLESEAYMTHQTSLMNHITPPDHKSLLPNVGLIKVGLLCVPSLCMRAGERERERLEVCAGISCPQW